VPRHPQDSWFDRLLRALSERSNDTHLLRQIMSAISDLNDKVDALQVSLDAKQAQIAAAIAAFEQTIADLTAQLSTGATAEQIQDVITKLDAAKTDLESTPDA
jgi:septal ring factor EnvC (AmiA/AmiB activator)